MTAGPGPRVGAILELLRPVAQEIIVAVDERADEATFAAVGGVADRVIAYPFAEPVDRPLPWLFSECSTDWMLSLDDDEVPSVALLDVLPALCADDRLVHYSIARGWIYPDTRTCLDDAPWVPDYQLRLFRTDPRLIRFSDSLHRPIIASGPGAFVVEPLWHLDTVLRDAETRLAKAHHYEQQRPGLRVGGRALNFGFYVPELRPGVKLATVPDIDRTLLDSIVGAEPRADGSSDMPRERVTRAEIDAHWPAALDRQDGEIELPRVPHPFIACEERAVTLRVNNTGSATWQWGRDAHPPVRCTSWWDEDGHTSAVWTPLPGPVEPGEALAVPAHVRAPRTPGRHVLHFDLVHENVGWFDVGISCEVDVLRRKRIAFLGADSAYVTAQVSGDPEVEPVLLRRSPRTGGEGYAEAPGLWAALLDDAPRSRLGFAAALAWRAARAVVGPQPAQLGSADVLVVAGPPPRERREQWVERTTVRVARRLGMRVEVERE